VERKTKGGIVLRNRLCKGGREIPQILAYFTSWGLQRSPTLAPPLLKRLSLERWSVVYQMVLNKEQLSIEALKSSIRKSTFTLSTSMGSTLTLLITLSKEN
jgi:hypothetical protein